MLHVCTEMRSSQFSAPPQDAGRGEGYQEFREQSISRGSAVLTSVCVQADLSCCLSC
jgi:hypothetical protein